MNQARIFVLGTFRVQSPSGAFLEGASPTVQSLGAYLALHQGEPLDRRRLAFLLWAHVPERVARRNLRQYLHRLRQFLQPVETEDPLILTESLTITFDPRHVLWVDALAFMRALQEAEAQEGPSRLVALRSAVELYRGDLLENIYDHWCESEREHYRQLYEHALDELIETHRRMGHLEDAVFRAEQALRVNPLRERTYRTLMELYHQLGDRARALEAYERCREMLQAELGVTPMPETEALYREIAYLGIPSSSPEMTTTPRTRSSPAGAPLSPVRPSVPPLIGREQDMAWLQAHAIGQEGRGALLLLEGEAGVGTTRLVTEWLAQVPDSVRVLAGEGGEFEHIIPYHPLKQALQEHVETLPWTELAYRERWQDALTYLIPSLHRRWPPSAAHRAPVHIDSWMMLEGVGWFLRALAERGPTVLWIDEAHWADHPTWQTAAYLGQRIAPDVPLTVILTYRPGEIADPSQRVWRRLIRAPFVQRRELQRLSKKQTYELARTILGPNVDPRLLTRLYDMTEGNPLFVIETARALLDVPERRVFLQTEPGSRGFSTPQRVRQVIESRLDLLSEQEHSLLQVASVLGTSFTPTTLTALADVEEADVLAALDTWLRRGLVQEMEQGYSFAHTLVQHVVYEELSLARRRWLHRRVAHHLMQQSGIAAATIAYHLARSDRPALAIPYYTQAAEKALQVRSYHEAQACALEILRLWRQQPTGQELDVPTRIDINQQLARAYSLSNMRDQALPLLAETRRLAEGLGDPRKLASVIIDMARLLWHQGDVAAAQDHAREALQWAQAAGDEATFAAALRMLGRTAIVLSAFDNAIAVLKQHIQSVPEHDPRQAIVWSYLAVAWSRVGHWQQAFQAANQAIAVAQALHNTSSLAVACMHQALVQAERGRWADAAASAREGLEQTAGLGFSPVHFMLQAVSCYAQGHLDDEAAAVAGLKRILQEAEREHYRVLLYLPHYFLGRVYYHHGRYRLAYEEAQRTRKLAEERGARWAIAVALRLEADALSALPSPDWPRIEERLVRSVRILQQVRARPDLARSYVSLRRLYDRAARMAWAVDCHFRATSIFEELGMLEELRQAQGGRGQTLPTSRTALAAPLTGPAWLQTRADEDTGR